MVQQQTTLTPERISSEFLDSVSFIAELEKAQQAGDNEIVEMNIETLQRLIADLAARQEELAQLQARADAVKDRHNIPTGQYVGR